MQGSYFAPKDISSHLPFFSYLLNQLITGAARVIEDPDGAILIFRSQDLEMMDDRKGIKPMVDLELPAFICIDFAAPGPCAVEDASAQPGMLPLTLSLTGECSR